MFLVAAAIAVPAVSYKKPCFQFFFFVVGYDLSAVSSVNASTYLNECIEHFLYAVFLGFVYFSLHAVL